MAERQSPRSGFAMAQKIAWMAAMKSIARMKTYFYAPTVAQSYRLNEFATE
jgi:hypothetical protein